MVKIDDRSLASIEGWFWRDDIYLFQWLLQDQADQGVQGNLLEIGAYLGKSTVVIGANLRAAEKFTVVDLFGAPADDGANQQETDDSTPASRVNSSRPTTCGSTPTCQPSCRICPLR